MSPVLHTAASDAETEENSQCVDAILLCVDATDATYFLLSTHSFFVFLITKLVMLKLVFSQLVMSQKHTKKQNHTLASTCLFSAERINVALQGEIRKCQSLRLAKSDI